MNFKLFTIGHQLAECLHLINSLIYKFSPPHLLFATITVLESVNPLHSTHSKVFAGFTPQTVPCHQIFAETRVEHT